MARGADGCRHVATLPLGAIQLPSPPMAQANQLTFSLID